uniref:Uncharacterized protein n=1 Tax=Arundo donax TaxID=35708 RepID=A0A0A8YT16_ARUDO
MSWYANQFLHFCRLQQNCDQINTEVTWLLPGGKV